MECTEIVLSSHALQRMFERGIDPAEVRTVVDSGEVIADYPNDYPYPSCVVLAIINGRALHVVVAVERESGRCIVITVYPPDPALWSHDYRTRRTS